MTQELGGGGIKVKNIKVKDIATVVMQNPRAGWNFNPLSTNFTKWSNTLKIFVGKLPANCLSVFYHFVGLALKGLNKNETKSSKD